MTEEESTSERTIEKVRKEVKKYLRYIEKHGINKFWHRKSKKLVLAVLAVRLKNGQIKLYRSMNVEVSLPAGTLCAERNVFGTAASDIPLLRRDEILVLGLIRINLSVLAPSTGKNIQLHEILTSKYGSEQHANPVWPCGVCSEWLNKLTAKTEHKIKVIAFKNLKCEEYFIQEY